RALLVMRLAGHPRAVEYANTLVDNTLAQWEKGHGCEYRLPEDADAQAVEKEWNELVAPALPAVEERLRTNLLFDAIWERVLDAGCRGMLSRMTLLRRPWEQELFDHLGEPSEPAAVARNTAERLGRTSLLEQVDLVTVKGTVRHFTLHPATVQFARGRFGEDRALCLETHRRLGDYLEEQAKSSPYIDIDIEAGYHLFEAGEYDRALELLNLAAD